MRDLGNGIGPRRQRCRMRELGAAQTQTVGRALAQVRREEARLLEAYRSGIISPAQLGQELELLKKRQSTLEVREGNLYCVGARRFGKNKT